MKMYELTRFKLNPWLSSISFVLLVACNQGPKEQTSPESTTEHHEHVERPKGMIWLDKAKQLCDNYETRRIAGIEKFEAEQNNGAEKFVPVQFVAFDFKRIKQYVEFVEQEAKEANVVPDSLRIYLGNYGEKGREPNRNTVFLLPTAQIGDTHGGFYIEENGEAQLIRDYWKSTNEGEGNQNQGPKSKASLVPAISLAPLHGGGSLILNVGQGGPPPHTDF